MTLKLHTHKMHTPMNKPVNKMNLFMRFSSITVLLSVIAVCMVSCHEPYQYHTTIVFNNESQDTVGVTWSFQANKYPPLDNLRDEEKSFVAPMTSSEDAISLPLHADFETCFHVDTISVFIVKKIDWDLINGRSADSLRFTVYQYSWYAVNTLADWSITYPDDITPIKSFEKKFYVDGLAETRTTN